MYIHLNHIESPFMPEKFHLLIFYLGATLYRICTIEEILLIHYNLTTKYQPGEIHLFIVSDYLDNKNY